MQTATNDFSGVISFLTSGSTGSFVIWAMIVWVIISILTPGSQKNGNFFGFFDGDGECGGDGGD